MRFSRITLITLAGLAALTLGWSRYNRPPRPGGGPGSAPPETQGSRLRAEGRVAAYPGADVLVGSDLGGTLTRVLVQEGDSARKGQLLALLDVRQEQASLREAQSHVRELETDLKFLDTEWRRQTNLQAGGISSIQALDQARNQLELTRTKRDAAQATADRLAVTISKSRITAPLEGKVVARLSHAGENIIAGARLFQICQLSQLRVEAEVDEFDLSRLQIGGRVLIRAEGQPETWSGRVAEIPSQVVGRKLKPQDPARPSDTRVLLVKIAIEGATPLKLGQRVELEWAS